MPIKAGPITPDAPAGANDAGLLGPETQRAVADAARRIEAAVQEGLEQLRAQSRVLADTASQQIEDASEYVSGQVRERPLAAAGIALGAGVLIGLLIAQATRRN